MANIFLVDLENVSWNSLLELNHEKITEKDRIYIFLGRDTHNCSYLVVDAITKSKAKTELIMVETGTPNALDFQLVYFLGAISANCKDNFFIISKDNGYRVLENFVPPISVSTVPSISAAFMDNQSARKRKDINKQTEREQILLELKASKVFNFKDYQSFSGNIVNRLMESEDLDSFKVKIPKISENSLHQDEILRICMKYFV